jgi:hypothetical protein
VSTETRVRAAFINRLGLIVRVGPSEPVYDASGAQIGIAGDLGFRFGPQPTRPDEIVMSKWVDDQGVLTVVRIHAADLTTFIGSLFESPAALDGAPPLVEDYIAACKAGGAAAFARYAAKFKTEGILG